MKKKGFFVFISILMWLEAVYKCWLWLKELIGVFICLYFYLMKWLWVAYWETYLIIWLRWLAFCWSPFLWWDLWQWFWVIFYTWTWFLLTFNWFFIWYWWKCWTFFWFLYLFDFICYFDFNIFLIFTFHSNFYLFSCFWRVLNRINDFFKFLNK